MADWAELHSDVVALIAGRLKEFEDFLAFGGVCRPWKSAATKDNFNSSSIPWLMLAEKKGEAFREFYILSRSKIVSRILLPEAAGKICYASQGWLVTVSQEDLGMHLLHPISRIRIPVPDPKNLLNDEPDCGELLYFYESFIQKAVLSSSPNSTGGGDYSLCVMYGNQSGLAIWRSAGDFSWAKVLPLKRCFSDVFYCQGKFLAISKRFENGIILVINAKDPTSTTEIILENFVICCAYDMIVDKLYLVECGGKLLVVMRQGVTVREPEVKELEELDEERIRRIDLSKEVLTYGTLYFRVFKLLLDLSSTSSCVIGDSHWEEVHDLGRRALFLGHNSSFCIDIDASNEIIKPDSIYFTDDAWESYLEPEPLGPNWMAPEGGGKDMGIYSLKDKTIVPHFQGFDADGDAVDDKYDDLPNLPLRSPPLTQSDGDAVDDKYDDLPNLPLRSPPLTQSESPPTTTTDPKSHEPNANPTTSSDPPPSDLPKPSPTSFEFWDEDEFEGLPAEAHVPETPKSTATPTDSIPDPIIAKKSPIAPVSRSYTVEIICVSFLIIFGIDYFSGKLQNEKLALAWATKFATKDSIFDKNFSLLGVGDTDDSPLLLKEGQTVFKFYASGRRYCQGMLATMELKSRHDLISKIYNTIVPCKDEITFEVYMNEDAMDNVVFAVAKMKAAKVMQKEERDLQRFATSVSQPNGRKWVAEELGVISESKEVAGDLITEVVLDQVFGDEAFEKYGKGFISMHFSDQNIGTTRITFPFLIPIPKQNFQSKRYLYSLKKM